MSASQIDIKQMRWQQVAALIIERFGCLVLHSWRPLKVGSIVNDLNVHATADNKSDQPFLVVGEATRKDWLRQCEFAGINLKHFDHPEYFYFIETD